MVERDEMLSEIHLLAKENGGKPLGRNRFFEAIGIREADGERPQDFRARLARIGYELGTRADWSQLARRRNVSATSRATSLG